MKQKNKKGFTLIELLAVIVILGIIAVIAVPVVKSITKDAKMKSFTNTARGIIRAGDLYYSKKDMMDEIDGDITFEFPNNASELEINGKLPEEGKMIINEDGDIALAITNGKYCVTKGFEDVDLTVSDDYEECVIPGGNTESTVTLSSLATTSSEVTSIPACVTNKTTCNPGTPVAIKVNDSEVYNFYVLSETDGKTTLIMDRNLGGKVAWITQADHNDNSTWLENGNNNKGPITALNYLNNQISNWTNIPTISSYTYDNNLNGTTNDWGYQKLVITDGTGILTSKDGAATTVLSGIFRTRLVTNEEITALVDANGYTMPTYLYENLSSEDIWGYWLLSADSYTTSPLAVLYYGQTCGSCPFVSDETNYGVRPVIELAK